MKRILAKVIFPIHTYQKQLGLAHGSLNKQYERRWATNQNFIWLNPINPWQPDAHCRTQIISERSNTYTGINASEYRLDDAVKLVNKIFKANDSKNAPQNMAIWEAYRDLREDPDSLSWDKTMELDVMKFWCKSICRSICNPLNAG